MEIMTKGLEHGEGWSDWFGVMIINIIIRGYYLQYFIFFFNLSDKGSVIVSSVISVHASGKPVEMVSILTILSS